MKPKYGTSHEWQLCPKCNGGGLQMAYSGTDFGYVQCDLCGGTKIISRQTGQPPEIKIKVVYPKKGEKK